MFINLKTNIKETIPLSIEHSFKVKNDSKLLINELKTHYNNNDIKMVLNILGTSFSKPVVQTDSNDYYLNHSENKTWNYNGSIFMDYRINLNKDKKILIYGHNSKYVDMPFKILENYMNLNYFKNHPYMELITNEGIRLYEVFSVFVETNDWSYMNLKFSQDSWYNHLLKLKKKSIYDTNIDINKDDEILILQTCSINDKYKNYNEKYLLIILRRIKYE